jgi:hypothetical protein
VSKQTFKLLNVDRGTCASYLSLTFDDLHFTQTRIAIYSSITDLVLNSEVNGKSNEDSMKMKRYNTEETESFYNRVNKEMNGNISQNDIETLYNTSVYVLVRSYENIQIKFNELKSQSTTELKQCGIDLKDLVSFCVSD